MHDTRCRILHVIDSLETGGAENLVYSLVTGVDDSKYISSVCTFGSESSGIIRDGLLEGGVHIHSLGQVGRYIGFPGRIRRIIRREGIDIVHGHIGGELHGHLGAIGTRASVVTTVHGIFHYNLRIRSAMYLAGLFKPNIRVAVSKEVKERYGCKHLIYNGVDPVRENGERGRHTLGINIRDEEVIVGIVGRLAPVKNHKNFIDAAAIILETCGNAKFLIVGDGPMYDQLVSYARERNITESVIFTGYRADASSLLGAMDISVVSSDSEGLPMAVLESMAAGTPVVATKVGGIPELVIDGVTGSLVDPGDPVALAGAIAKLVANDDLRARMGELSRERIEDTFSRKIMIGKYERLYDSLLPGSTRNKQQVA